MKTDVTIVGAGPAGSATALFLEREGIQSTIIEKDQFPRYHIGESLTGECGSCLRDLGLEEKMNNLRFPVKQGVRVFGSSGKNTFYVPVKTRLPDSTLIPATTWQVRRSKFDALLLDQARERGVKIIPAAATTPVLKKGRVIGLEYRTPDGKNHRLDSSVLVDASGSSTFLCNSGLTSPKSRGDYSRQVAIFSQVAKDSQKLGPDGNDTLIFYQKKNHWGWFIPLDEEMISVGVVSPADYFKSMKESKSAFLQRELHELNPELAKRLPEIRLVDKTRAISNYSYHIRNFSGEGYLCVGDSHRFIDPVFSFGVYFSIKEAEFAGQEISKYLGGALNSSGNPFLDYQSKCESGQDVIEEVIKSFWDNPLGFAYFTHYKYVEDLIDLFAGRVYMDTPSPGLSAIISNNRRMDSKNEVHKKR